MFYHPFPNLRMIWYQSQLFCLRDLQELNDQCNSDLGASITKANYLTTRGAKSSRRIERSCDKKVARKETTLVYEESSNPRADTKGVVMVITKRQEDHGGCFGPLSSLLSLSLGECLYRQGRFRAILLTSKQDRNSRVKGGRDVIEKERFLDREENREQEKWKEECSQREFGVKEASMVPR